MRNKNDNPDSLLSSEDALMMLLSSQEALMREDDLCDNATVNIFPIRGELRVNGHRLDRLHRRDYDVMIVLAMAAIHLPGVSFHGKDIVQLIEEPPFPLF